MTDPIVRSVTYADAETRGKLRAWKKKVAEDYAAVSAVLERFIYSDGEIVADMVLRSRVGKRRALEKIKSMLGPSAALETVKLDGRQSYAVFSIFKPRDSVCVKPSNDSSEGERQSLMQDCVAVNYAWIGFVPLTGMAGVAEGLWTLEIPDHALGRAVERSGLLHPGVLIREAHANLLGLPTMILGQETFTDERSRGIYIKAGLGAFAGHLHHGPDISTGGEHSAYVRVKTWLSEDQLADDQIVLCEKGKPGECLGDGWLAPRPMRRIERDGDRLVVATWRP